MKENIIVDIDGTISKVGDRLKYLQQDPKNLDAFYDACGEDEPKDDILRMISILEVEHHIIFCTNRRESVRKQTTEWLLKVAGHSVDETNLLMRKDKDWRKDTLVKPDLLKKAGIELDTIALVLEDRNSMVAKWRELGLTCLQVADGDF